MMTGNDMCKNALRLAAASFLLTAASFLSGWNMPKIVEAILR